MDEFIAYQELLVKAEDVWHRAKEASDFDMFCPYLEKLFDYKKKFAGYISPDKDPYDHCLNEYEEGLNMEACDRFFKQLRDGIVPLLKRVSEVPQIDDSLRRGCFPAAKQEELSWDEGLKAAYHTGNH